MNIKNTLFCVYCWEHEKVRTPVEFRVTFGSMSKFAEGKKETYVTNHIYTYFSCPYHGAVSAYDDKFNIFEKPVDFFGELVITDWDIIVKGNVRKKSMHDEYYCPKCKARYTELSCTWERDKEGRAILKCPLGHIISVQYKIPYYLKEGEKK